MEELLSALPANSRVALVHMRGSLCPITLGHVQCYVEARRILLNDPRSLVPRPARLERFDECVGVVSLNRDYHVSAKVLEKGQKPLSYDERAGLVHLATAELPWLELWHGGHRELLPRWPHLNFVVFDMNGADDVVKYQKWRWAGAKWDGAVYRLITIGRPGFTSSVVKGMQQLRLDPDDGHCIIGPELPDISSTAARAAAARGDYEALKPLLHPAVAEWLLANSAEPDTAKTKAKASAPSRACCGAS
mmetsp:Transcript_82105/g.190657  ORF Transcript_82105/g.190657 Transcript_82105/m.190657 type:complete len:248 (-) Transcript_82105:64-807(-)